MPNLLVTGKWGEPHVTSAQQRNYNAGIAGDGQYVMSGMTATMTNSNTCHIDPGVASFNGADVEVPAGGVDLTIENGTQGQKRNDLVVLRYTKNAGSQVEDVSLAVIKGTPTSGTATDPAHNEGSILDGDSPCDMPLWRIPLNGIDVGDPVQLFKDFESISDLRETISPKFVGSGSANILGMNVTANAYYSEAIKSLMVSVESGSGSIHTSGATTVTKQLLTLPSGMRPSSGKHSTIYVDERFGKSEFVIVESSGIVKVGVSLRQAASNYGFESGTVVVPIV